MFKIRHDAEHWFRYLNLPLQFDRYYFCLMTGLAKGQRSTRTHKTRDIITHFPEQYAQQGRLIVAAFLRRELQRMTVDLTNREQLHEHISKRIDHRSPAYLTNDGFRGLNAYAHGGFDVLCDDWFEAEPRTLGTFLVRYRAQMKDDTLRMGSRE